MDRMPRAGRRSHLTALAAAGLFCAPVLTDVPATAQVRIGVAAPLSGPLAAFGDAAVAGARQAAAAVSARGGIAGEPIEIVVADDLGDPARARAAAQTLVSEGVVAVIGHVTAGPSLEAAPIYAEAGIPMITPAVTEPRLTEDPAWNVFRLAPTDARQGGVAARHLAALEETPRVAIVHDKSGFGKGVADDFRRVLDEAGIVDVFYEGLDTGDASYASLARRIAERQPTHVYFGGLAPEAAILLRNLREAGSDAVLVASDGIAGPVFASLDPAIGAGTLMTARPATADNPAATTIAGAIVAEAAPAEGEEAALPAAIVPLLAPEGVVETLHPVALDAYAAVEAITAAAGAVGRDGRAIAERLRSGPVETVLGPLSFDETGDADAALLAVHAWRPGPLGGLDYLGNVVE